MLVIADSQTKGRGRQGRVWVEPDAALYSSLALDSVWPVVTRALITLCTAVALSDAIEGEADVRTEIKWPNDLLVRGKKVAGILVEGSGDEITIGCGVNLWWRSPMDFAAAVLDDRPDDGLIERLAIAWVDNLLGHLARGPENWPRQPYLDRSWTVGRTVRWDEGSGKALDIDAAGGLIVETPSGIITITAGEVHTTRSED